MEHETLSVKEKLTSLFQFVSEFCRLRQSPIINQTNYPWKIFLDEIGNAAINAPYCIELGQGNTILKLQKATLPDCPPPDSCFRSFLDPGWDLWDKNTVSVKSELIRHTADGYIEKCRLEDDPIRMDMFNCWRQSRDSWIKKCKAIQTANEIFNRFYRLYFEQQKTSGTKELLVSNGIFCDAKHPEIEHPLVLRRVKTKYDAQTDVITIENTDTPAELYTDLFQNIDDLNINAIGMLEEELKLNDYHPLDKSKTFDFLTKTANILHADHKVIDGNKTENWEKTYRILVCWHPLFFLRDRTGGVQNFIRRIEKDIQEHDNLPAAISELVNIGEKSEKIEDNISQVSDIERLSAIGGESIDVLLANMANREQLQIAQRLEKQNAVVVQGPPGTGKTHTIANLIGHFLAQGKTVLVTSLTEKALKVLKDKIAEGLKDLCVSLLEDSKADLRASIDGIAKQIQIEVKDEELTWLKEKRESVISELEGVRKQILAILRKEYASITYEGVGYSPIELAQEIKKRLKELDFIPGKIQMDASFPFTEQELNDIYKFNDEVLPSEETEFCKQFPDLKDQVDPQYFIEQYIFYKTELDRHILKIKSDLMYDVRTQNPSTITFNGTKKFSARVSSKNKSEIDALKKLTQNLNDAPWFIRAVTDGKLTERRLWDALVILQNATAKKNEEWIASSSTHSQKFNNADHNTFDPESLRKSFQEILHILSSKFPKIKMFFTGKKCEYQKVLGSFLIDEHEPQTVHDCEFVIQYLDLCIGMRKCQKMWDQLLNGRGYISFDELDASPLERIRIAAKQIPLIVSALNWYSEVYKEVSAKLNILGISENSLFAFTTVDSNLRKTEKIFSVLKKEFPLICDVISSYTKMLEVDAPVIHSQTTLSNSIFVNNTMCQRMLKAISAYDGQAYQNVYNEFLKMLTKRELWVTRNYQLQKLDQIAPEWAKAIRTRQGVHGKNVPPENLFDAWKWKQLSAKLDQQTADSYDVLLKKSTALSVTYRETTRQLATKQAMKKLRERTSDKGKLQSLTAWGAKVKKLGRRGIPTTDYERRELQELMKECQTAVPAWIMPIHQAMEFFDPAKCRFDVVIMDEASQPDVSALPVLYLGKKLIIVGDDEQVTPENIGKEKEKLIQKEQIHLHGKIPHSELYASLNTSIFDLAKITFVPHLMLKEHFRCVPDIISYSNTYSYHGEIKPLRDANSKLLPAVIKYRVENGVSSDEKKNLREAREIALLIQACQEQEEYHDKTIGVISLVGYEQSVQIEREINKIIPERVISNHQILCGSPREFQGDERDVIFLSMVYSGNGLGPLKATYEENNDDRFKKRYNVAVSRAKDQLWIVHSLDPENDLKPGDIRRQLLQFDFNAEAQTQKDQQIKKDSESPFEELVATDLSHRGYCLIQQKWVGAYRLDMVVFDGKRMVAVECDGNKFHSTPDAIVADLERQTILERLGWRFIRIRGSEYFRNREKTIEHVVQQLNALEIYPLNEKEGKERESDLLNRINQFVSKLKEKLKKKVSVSDDPLPLFSFEKTEQNFSHTTDVQETTNKKNQEKSTAGKLVQGDLFQNSSSSQNSDSQQTIRFSLPLVWTDVTGGLNDDDKQELASKREAAKSGKALDQYLLGDFLAQLNEDEEAIKWILLAAEQGLQEAQQELSDMYERGKGVAPDPRQAAEWRRKASEA